MLYLMLNLRGGGKKLEEEMVLLVMYGNISEMILTHNWMQLMVFHHIPDEIKEMNFI